MSEKQKLPREYRAWDAAQAMSLASDWSRWPRRIQSDIRFGLKALVARSRQQCQNNDYAKYFLKLVKDNVVGSSGFRFRSLARTPRGKPDDKTRAAIESAWADFTTRGMIDVTGKLSWRDVQSLTIETVARDGEAIPRAVPWDNRYGRSLQLIDPQRLDIQHNDAALQNGNWVSMGVEMDEWDRPVAYHLMDDDKTTYQSTYQSRNRQRITADEIYHIHLPEWVSQSRGIPWAATALDRLYQIDRYEDAEVAAARLGAERVGNYKKSLDAVGPGGAVADEDEEGFVQDVQKGEYGILPPGWEFDAVTLAHPNAVYPDFIKAGLRGAASGLGVGYNSLANDLEGVNYSSLRQGAIVERDMWKGMQSWFADWFLIPVFNDWLQQALAMDAIPGIKATLSARDSEFYRVSFQGRRWQWVDPEKEITANEKAVALRIRSISSIIREQGDDPDQVWEEIASDKERMRKYGILPPEQSQVTEPDAGDDDALRGMIRLISDRAQAKDPTVNITNEIPATERQGEPVINITNQVETPAVHVTNDVQPASVDVSAPKVTVESPIINVPPQDAPDVQVAVTNEVKTPEVNVDVNVPSVDRRVDFDRDRDGNITGATIEDE